MLKYGAGHRGDACRHVKVAGWAHGGALGSEVRGIDR